MTTLQFFTSSFSDWNGPHVAFEMLIQMYMYMTDGLRIACLL